MFHVGRLTTAQPHQISGESESSQRASLAASGIWIPHQNIYKSPRPPIPFISFSSFFSSYLPCLGGCDQEGGPPRIGPCIAQRGGTIRSTAFGSLTGVFFGTFHLVDIILSFSSGLGPVARGWRRGLVCVVQRARSRVM